MERITNFAEKQGEDFNKTPIPRGIIKAFIDEPEWVDPIMTQPQVEDFCRDFKEIVKAIRLREFFGNIC